MEAILAKVSQLDGDSLADPTSEADYDAVAKSILNDLSQLSSPDATFLNEFLSNTDSTTHTIPYIYVVTHVAELSVKNNKNARNLPADLLPEGKLWPYITKALFQFDPIQARYVGQQLYSLVEIVFHGAEQSGNYVPALQVLYHVITTLDPSSSTLSMTHWFYVRLCLYAKAYIEAISILELPIYHIPTSDATRSLERRLARYRCSQSESGQVYINPETGLSGKITTRKFLEYYFMGALCWIGARQWQQAQMFLEVILVMPTQQNVASRIMVEAYKKWCLLSLILHGKDQDLPRGTSSGIQKHLVNLAKAYHCIIDAFKEDKLEKLINEVQAGQVLWTDDCNYGLILEVMAAHRRFSVLRLGDTYAALPIEQVTRLTSPDPSNVQETLVFVQNLISTGLLQAQVSPPKTEGSLGTLRFLETSSNKSEAQVEAELKQRVILLKGMLSQIASYDHQIAVNKEFPEALLKAKRARDQDKKSAAANNANEPFTMGRPPANDQDEEMMEEPW